MYTNECYLITQQHIISPFIINHNRHYTGLGYNEVYITQTAENQTSVPPGSLVKALQDHGLQQFPSMRNRWMQTLVAADGASLVLLATRGEPRADGQPNEHRMFRLQVPAPNTTHGFYFHHVPGPWMQLTKVECLQIVDINQDGLDDILMCNKYSRAFLFLQNPDSSWTEVELWEEQAKDWRSARIADVNGDGVNDLIVVGPGGQKPKKKPESYVRVFAGVSEPPYFHLSSSLLWEMVTPFATPDVQVLDVNSDGIVDIYVVQTDESTSGNYCASNYDKSWRGPVPPVSYIPDLDMAPDILLVGLGNGNFTHFNMTHAEPGCGAHVELFGNNRTMILAQGTMGKVGHNLLLQW